MKGTTGDLVRTMRSARRESSRNSKLRRIALEGLESRMLLATLPTPTAVSGSQSFISYNGDAHGSQTSQTIAVDPQDPSKMVAAWVSTDPTRAPGPTVFVQAASSSDGGQTWKQFLSGDLVRNPTATAAPFNYTQSTDPSVAYPRSANLA